MELQIYTLNDIIEYVRNSINEMTKANLNYVADNEVERLQINNRKKRFQDAYQDCIFGSKQDKELVKSIIKEIVVRNIKFTEYNINHIIAFNYVEVLTIQDKFDILIHIYKCKYNYSALGMMIKEYDLAKLKKSDDQIFYKITKDDIENIFSDKNPLETLSLDDKINIVIQRVYSIIKGYRQVDDLIDMKIDGISGGVSGLTESMINDLTNEGNFDLNEVPRSFESVWIMFQGKSIHLEFLSFGSYEELARTCHNIYAYGNPGALNESTGYIVNRLKDGSRVVVFVPPFCESYVFFIRKFELDDHSLEFLVTSSLPKTKPKLEIEGTETLELTEILGDKKVINTDEVIELLKYLAKGGRNIEVTGQQGTGKTTFLKALMKYIYNVYNLRVLELAPELQLRKLFPNRNIVSVVETQTVTSKAALDVFKKSDGSVTVIGEIASDDVVALAIQLNQVASLFTWFTHHAKKAIALVDALRNSALNTGLFSNEAIAEEQVLQILSFNIHLAKDIEGRRYIERITEFVPIDNDIPYTEIPEGSLSNEELLKIQTQNNLNYYRKITDKKLYDAVDIVKFDLNINSYIFLNNISQKSYEGMVKEMIIEDSERFKSFYKKAFLEVE